MSEDTAGQMRLHLCLTFALPCHKQTRRVYQKFVLGNRNGFNDNTKDKFWSRKADVYI